MASTRTEEKRTLTPEEKALRKHKIKNIIITILPLAALAVLFVIYVAIVAANGYNMALSLENILNDAIVLVLVATGAVFIFTLGSFDISLGASTLFSATIGIIAYNATGSIPVMFLVCIGVAVACSLLNSVIASVFHLPMFVTTVAMLSVLTSVSSTILTTQGSSTGTNPSISVSDSTLRAALSAIDTIPVKLIILAVFMVLVVFIYNITKVGRRQKFLGGNPLCAKMTGISSSVYGIIAFFIAGIGVGLAAAVNITYVRSVSTGTASDIGMSVFIAIVFGGMPISGGARSRIYAALVGGFSYTLLNGILNLLLSSVSGAYGYVQIVSAALFLAVVCVVSINYRTQNLPR